MYKSSVVWQEGEWIPDDWQRAEQIAAIDDTINGVIEWITDLRSLAESLRYAESHQYTDFGYEDEQFTQYPGGQVAYEGAHPEDFDLSIAYGGERYIPTGTYTDPITSDYPSPTSIPIIQLEDDLEEVLANYVLLEDNKEFSDLISSWSNAIDDPAFGAIEVGEFLAEYATEVEQVLLSALNTIRQEWINEIQRLESQSEQNHTDELYGKGAYLAIEFTQDAYDLAEEAINAVEQSTPTRAEEEIKMYTRAFEAMTNDASETSVMSEDVAFLRGAVDDLKEISGRKQHDDIRAWESRSVQKQDAILAIDRVRSYLEKRLNQIQEIDEIKKLNRIARKTGNSPVPNYKFSVGQMVKVMSSNRYGKIIGSKVDSETGEHIYEVRVNGMDRPKLCDPSDLESSE